MRNLQRNTSLGLTTARRTPYPYGANNQTERTEPNRTLTGLRHHWHDFKLPQPSNIFNRHNDDTHGNMDGQNFQSDDDRKELG